MFLSSDSAQEFCLIYRAVTLSAHHTSQIPKGGIPMKKILTGLATSLLLVVALGTAAGAQDPVVGIVESDPATVPEAGEHTVTATGSGFLPDSTLLLGSCTAPGDELVPGVSSLDEITAAAGAINPLEHCDLGNALQVTTDADGAFSQEVTATMDTNFFLSAGTLDGSQAGGVWIPILDPALAAQLAVTGVDSGMLAGAGLGLMALGAFAVHASRRKED
jgi:hypothetical protein